MGAAVAARGVAPGQSAPGRWAYLISIEPYRGTRPLEIEVRAAETITQARRLVESEVRRQRQHVMQAQVDDQGRTAGEWAALWGSLRARARALTVYGGTVGPFPDETIIDVRRVLTAVLVHQIQARSHGSTDSAALAGTRAIVNAFNQPTSRLPSRDR